MALNLDREIALNALKVAKEGGYLETIPSKTPEIIELAEFYIEQAKQESVKSAKMKRDPVIKELLNIRTLALQNKSEDAFDQFLNGNEAKHNLPIPPDPEGDATELPRDFTSIGDKEIRRLHGEYNSYLARARWMLAVSTNHLASATHMRDDAYRKGYKTYSSKLELTEQRVTKDLIDSHVKTEEENYKKYDTDAREAQEKTVIYKALVEIYSGNVDRLSREWTFRQQEWEKENGRY